MFFWFSVDLSKQKVNIVLGLLMAFARNLEGPVFYPRDALHLSTLFSNASALFCAMEPSQPLSHQSLTHSFPCNGGRGYFAKNPPPVFRTFFQLPYALSLLFATYENCRGVPQQLPEQPPRVHPPCLGGNSFKAGENLQGR